MFIKNLSASSIISLSCLVSVVFISDFTTGCALIAKSQQVSATKAERIINKWKGNRSGTIKVVGIRENPDNTAVGTLEVSNLEIQVRYQGSKTYSGSGKATFSRYTDGRWALTELVFSDGSIANTYYVDDLNITDE